MLNIIHALGMTLLHFFWQGALVGIALWLLLFIIKRPQQRYLLACLSLLLLSLLPVITYLQQPIQGVASDSVEVAPSVTGVIASTALQNDANVGLLAPVALSNNAVESSTIALETPRATWRIWRIFNHGMLEPFLPYIVLAWLLGVLAFSLRLLAGYLWLHHMRARALTSVPPALATTLASLKERLGIPFTVQLRHSDKVIVPMVMGIFKPIILLPSSSLMGLSMSQLETILAHELAHIQRHDYLVNMLQGICEALLFYHPVMWWVNRVIRHERELCCDDIAVRLTNQPKTYAHALSLLAHNSIHNKTTMAAQQLAPSATGGSMYQRIQRILQLSKTRQHTRPALTGLISLALLGAVIFTLLVTAQENRAHDVASSPIWLAFAGDIRADETGFTLVSSPDMPSFFHLDELDNEKRSVGSALDYSQSLETTFNFDDFEPWAADILRETVTSLEMTDEGMPIYSALLSYESGKINFIDARTTVMPLEGVTEEVINNGFVMNDWGITYYLYQLQENDASRLIALEPYIKPLVGAIQDEESRIFTEAMYITDDSVQADEIWFTVVGDVRFDRKTIILSPSAEHEAFFVVEERGGQGRSFRADSGAVIRRLAMRELEPWVREILTFDRFVVNFTMEDADTINLYRTVHHKEPARPPTRFVIVKDMNALEPLETETLTHISSVPADLRDDIIESLTEAIQRKKHGVLSDDDAVTYLANLQEAADISTVVPEQLEEFLNNFDDDARQAEARAMLANYTLNSPYRDSLTFYEQRHNENFSATAIDALTTVLNYREQGMMPDAILVQYLRDVQLGNPILPNEAKPLLDNLIAGLASASQAEMAELFSYADMNTPPQWFVWNPKNKPHLWLTIAGDFLIEDDSITFYSSPEQPSFLIVEEVTGQRRRYSPSIAYDQARETRIALNDMDAWAADAIENLLLILPERPSKHYANLDPHKDTQSAVYIRHNIVQEPIRYANTILLTENTDDRVTAGQEAQLEDFIRTLTAEPRDEEHARLITLLTWREMQRAIQRKAHGLLNDELAMGYLRALHEQGETRWQQHSAEITSLISFIEDDALRSEAQELF